MTIPGFEFLEVDQKFLNRLKDYKNNEMLAMRFNESWYSIEDFFDYSKAFVAVREKEIEYLYKNEISQNFHKLNNFKTQIPFTMNEIKSGGNFFMDKKAGSVFQRIEKKYIMTKKQCADFREAIEPYMELDQFGLHTICNIYYDTDKDELIRRSIEKPPYKEKLRLRTYGAPVPGQESFIELKKKYNKVVYKRREMLPIEEAMAYLNYGMKPSKDTQILREIQYFMEFYKPEPKLYLAYDREAYFGKEDPELRLTIDHRIRSREYDLDLTCGDYGHEYFGENETVLEIKVAGAFPLWLSHLLAELEIYPVSFSKYGSIFKKEHLAYDGAMITFLHHQEHSEMVFA